MSRAARAARPPGEPAGTHFALPSPRAHRRDVSRRGAPGWADGPPSRDGRAGSGGWYERIKYATPHLRERGGAVVIVSSGQGTRSFSQPGSHAYACSKAAQAVLAKKLALELARHGVRVNVVCPGSTYTNINDSGVRRSMDKIALPVEYPEGKVLLRDGRKADADQVARLISFLASDDADVISGSEVWIDGTMSLVMG